MLNEMENVKTIPADISYEFIKLIIHDLSSSINALVMTAEDIGTSNCDDFTVGIINNSINKSINNIKFFRLLLSIKNYESRDKEVIYNYLEYNCKADIDVVLQGIIPSNPQLFQQFISVIYLMKKIFKVHNSKLCIIINDEVMEFKCLGDLNHFYIDKIDNAAELDHDSLPIYWLSYLTDKKVKFFKCKDFFTIKIFC